MSTLYLFASASALRFASTLALASSSSADFLAFSASFSALDLLPFALHSAFFASASAFS